MSLFFFVKRIGFCQLAKSQQAIVDNSRREFLQQEKCQQAIDGFAVELSQTTVCEIFALAKTDRPAGRFNRRQQPSRYASNRSI
ncbi:hypothetical protein COS70_00610 [Candidatus Micrarchaeota archaeon CG06_land_8_20_14_3_00_50_6]|nr:MAG: hypothetical protein COS70_00610 [Candidatus Micrarchaeota archaeon CG06_land_8_20_14_3_00_50_6]